MADKINAISFGNQFEHLNPISEKQVGNPLAPTLQEDFGGSPFNSSLQNFQASLRKTEINNFFNTDSADDLKKFLESKEFKQLDSVIQEKIKTQLDKVKGNSLSVKNTIELAKSGDFRKADKEIQNSMLDALAKRPEDKVFREVLVSLASKPDFKDFDKIKQLKVIEDLDKFADTTSYKGDAANKISDEDKTFLLEKVRKTSIFSGKDSTNITVRNTLDHIISGDIQLKLYEKDTSTGAIEFGYNKGGTKDIYLNKKANDTDYKEFIDTLAHESNHALNGNVKMKYVTDIFMNEYRAHLVGKTAAGKKINETELKAVINELVLSEPKLDDKTKKPLDGYSEIRLLYRNNKNFKTLIDQVVKDIDSGTLVNATDMKNRLIKAGYGSDYVKNTNNTDNQ